MDLIKVLLAQHQNHAGVAIEKSHHHEMLALSTRANRVLIETGHHVDRSAYQRRESLRAPA